MLCLGLEGPAAFIGCDIFCPDQVDQREFGLTIFLDPGLDVFGDSVAAVSAGALIVDVLKSAADSLRELMDRIILVLRLLALGNSGSAVQDLLQHISLGVGLLGLFQGSLCRCDVRRSGKRLCFFTFCYRCIAELHDLILHGVIPP